MGHRAYSTPDSPNLATYAPIGVTAGVVARRGRFDSGTANWNRCRVSPLGSGAATSRWSLPKEKSLLTCADDRPVFKAGRTRKDNRPTEESLANQKMIVRSVDSFAALVAACEVVAEEVRQRADVEHSTWNPDAHIELTLTVAECRAIIAALTLARKEM